MPTVFPRAYDEAAAKAAYVDKLDEYAATQDLTEDLRVSTRNLSIIFTVIGTVFVGMRFLARKRQGTYIGADDWLIVFSLLLLYGNFIFNIVLINEGVGLHSGALTLEQLIILNKTLVGAEMMYVTSVNFYKISLLFLYHRIFPLKSIRLGGYICGGMSTLWMFGANLAAILQCIPRQKTWHPWVQGTCIDLFLTQLCVSVPVIMCDIAILALPVKHVWQLKTNLTQRIFIMGIFLLGSYVVFTSCYRFAVYLEYRASDIPYTLARPIAWNVIEVSSGIVSACLPTLGPLVRLVFTSLYPTSMQRSTGHSGGVNSKNVQTIGGTGGQPHSRSHSRGWMRDLSSRDGSDDGELGLTSVAKAHGGVNVTVTYSQKNSSDNLSNDEIPLTAIRQETVVEWKVETLSSLEQSANRPHGDLGRAQRYGEGSGSRI